jgi:hypothetical protein
VTEFVWYLLAMLMAAVFAALATQLLLASL